MTKMTIAEALNAALDHEMEKDKTAIEGAFPLLGQRKASKCEDCSRRGFPIQEQHSFLRCGQR